MAILSNFIIKKEKHPDNKIKDRIMTRNILFLLLSVT